MSDEIQWSIPPENRNTQWDDLRLERESELHSCGFDEDSFACKIRHISINTGVCKAANDA